MESIRRTLADVREQGDEISKEVHKVDKKIDEMLLIYEEMKKEFDASK